MLKAILFGLLMTATASTSVPAPRASRFADLGFRTPSVIAYRLGPAPRGMPPPTARFHGAPVLSQVHLDAGRVDELLTLLSDDRTYAAHMLACRSCDIGLLLSENGRAIEACISPRCQQIRVGPPSDETLLLLSPEGVQRLAAFFASLLPPPHRNANP